MNLLEFNLYETTCYVLSVAWYFTTRNGRSLVYQFSVPSASHTFFDAIVWHSMGKPWYCPYLNLFIQSLNMLFFFKLRISRFKVDVPSATHCPFRNTILDCHVLSVQNAIIPPVTSSNCYFFDYLIFSIKQEKNKKLGRRRMACQIYRLQFWIL